MMEKTTVCIVEDSVTFAEWLQNDLAVFDEIEVTGKADTVESAILLIKKMKPDIVILDLWLNEGTGFDLLEIIRDMEENPVVFVFTNYPWPTLKTKCLEMGAEGFFEKSSEYFGLIDTIRSHKKSA